MKKLTTFILSAVFLIGGSVMATAKNGIKLSKKVTMLYQSELILRIDSALFLPAIYIFLKE